MLARIVRIVGFEPMEGYDQIHLALMNDLGWKVVVRKEDFVVGSLGVYIVISTRLPVLSEGKEWVPEGMAGKVLKTRKFGSYISQGLLLAWPSVEVEGMDVTNILGVTRFLGGDEIEPFDSTQKTWPEGVPKTGEDRVQNRVTALANLCGREVVITQKWDGRSHSTFMLESGVFNASRCVVGDVGVDIEICQQYNLQNKRNLLNFDCVIQGEIVGPKINGGRHKIHQNEFRAFNIWHINEMRYLVWDDVVNICGLLGLQTVPVVWRGRLTPEIATVAHMLKIAGQVKYSEEFGHLGEGIVLQTCDAGSRWSCKAISNEYLIKHSLA